MHRKQEMRWRHPKNKHLHLHQAATGALGWGLGRVPRYWCPAAAASCGGSPLWH